MAGNCRECLRKAWYFICLLTVEPALFLVELGNGISATATQVLMYDKVCIMLLKDVDMCVARNFTSEEQILVQQQASLWEFYRTLTSSLPAVFLIVIYSNLVDRWSKKYTMLFAPVGYILSMVVYLVCSIYMESSPAYMLIGSLILGLSGGLLAMIGACLSYLSATASPGMLIIHISLAEAALLASATITAFASGVLLEAVGYILVYIIGIVINVVLCLYVLIRIKDISLSASVLYHSAAEAASPAASESSASPANCENALEKAEDVRQRVDDDEFTIHMDCVIELEITGHLSLCEENGLAPRDTIAGGVDENSETKKSHSENKYLSQENLAVEKVMEIGTPPQNGTLAAIAPSTFSDGSPIPLQNSQNESQLEQSANSSTCDVCALFSRTACTVWGYARMYVNTAIKRREHNKRKGIIAILCIVLVDVICVYATTIGLCYLFVSQEPLSWSTATYGYFVGTMRGMKGFCLLVIMPLFKRLNVLYTKVIIISLVSSIISGTVFALSLYTWMAFFCKAFGMIGSLESMGFIISSVIFNIGIYPATVDIFSGLAILIASLILLLPLAIAIWLHVFTRNMARIQLPVIEQTVN